MLLLLLLLLLLLMFLSLFLLLLPVASLPENARTLMHRFHCEKQYRSAAGYSYSGVKPPPPHTHTCECAHADAQVALRVLAELAVATVGLVAGDHVVTWTGADNTHGTRHSCQALCLECDSKVKQYIEQAQ
jgi:hypothetical protein